MHYLRDLSSLLIVSKQKESWLVLRLVGKRKYTLRRYVSTVLDRAQTCHGCYSVCVEKECKLAQLTGRLYLQLPRDKHSYALCVQCVRCVCIGVCLHINIWWIPGISRVLFWPDASFSVSQGNKEHACSICSLQPCKRWIEMFHLNWLKACVIIKHRENGLSFSTLFFYGQHCFVWQFRFLVLYFCNCDKILY